VALSWCSDLSPAAWLVSSDLPWDRLVTFGPGGFESYARLRFLPDPTGPGQSENDAVFGENHPSDNDQLRRLVRQLVAHTTTPDELYFCLWDGWGWTVRERDAEWSLEPEQRRAPSRDLPTWPDAMPSRYVDRPGRGGDGFSAATGDAFPGRYVPLGGDAAPPEPCAPKVVLPNRAYFLFTGTLTSFVEHPELPNPAFVWPADRAWCVANDVDPHWAGIGGSAAAIADLLADSLLDAVPAEFGAPLPFYR
jgi:hypothetical protein